MRTPSRALCVVFLAVWLSGPLFSADIRVPRLELMSRAFLDEDVFRLTTRVDLEMALEGGYKFGADVGFRFQNQRIEEPSELTGPPYDDDEVERINALFNNTLRFQYARATTREVFGAPLDLIYFTGSIDRFASGREFERRFATRPFASEYAGFRYFPDGVQYDGIHAVRGTGLQLRGPIGSDRWSADLYLYQDEQIRPGVFSGDGRVLFNHPQVKIETFVGATFPEAAAGVYRGGMLLFLDSGVGGEFLAQVGLPYWAPDGSGDDLSLDDFFIMIEPRVRLDSFGIFLTLFWHPAFYEQRPTGEEGSLDLNMKLLIGNPFTGGAYGGIDNTIQFTPEGDEQVELSLSPFLRVATSGVLWDMTLRAKVYPFDLTDAIQAFFGIRTEF